MMESLFFNAQERRYRTSFRPIGGGSLHRIDISNGIVVLHLKSARNGYRQTLRGIDRLAVLTLVNKGGFILHGPSIRFDAPAGYSYLYTSARQDFDLAVAPGSDILIIAVADFFLKRYLCGIQNDPVDHLYRLTQSSEPLQNVDRQPIDALSQHLAKKIATPRRNGTMQPLRIEHDLIELLIHRFDAIEPAGEKLDDASTKIVQKAVAYLAEHFTDPPNIEALARICATNPTTLKRLFKKAHGRTIGEHIRRLRLQKANRLLKEGDKSIREVAHSVGFKHQGHFSHLFYEAFGIYPKDLK